MDFNDFRRMVARAVHNWKQMGLKSSPRADALLVDNIDKAIDKALQERKETEEVMTWMRDVEEDPAFIHFVLSRGKKYCLRWCPTLKSHHQLSVETDKFVQDVVELLKKIRRTHEKALSKTEQKVAAAAVKDFMYFDSRSDVWEEIMVALQSPRISSIGVYGEAGVGKTMLVQEIKRKAEKLELFDDVVMAKVTNNPDMRRIQDGIAHDLGLELPDRVTAADRIKSRLTNRKVLVILDDIWARIDLEEVGIPFGNKHKQNLKQPTEKKNEEMSSVQAQTGSTVLLTSRDSGVLSRDMHAHKIIEVGPLNKEEARKLFVMTAGEQAKKRIFQRTAKINEKVSGKQSNAEIDEIVKGCNQLPIAITTLASTLEDRSLVQWRTTMKKLRSHQGSSELEVNSSGMAAILCSAIKLRYDELESKQLKQTLLLCSLMSHNAGLQDLLKYVIGLELFQDSANSVEAIRGEAGNLVKKLKDSFWLLDGDSNMHFDMCDPTREVAVSIASGDHHVLALREDAAKENLDRDKLKFFKWIYLSNVDASQLLNRLKCPQLTLFHLANNDLDMKIPDDFFKGAKGLKVLGLTRMHLSSIPSSISLLVNLRTLRLDQSELGANLGSIMGNLKNLQVLSLVGCDVKELPQEAKELGKLKLLDLSDCTKLIVIPPDVLKSLSQLEELYLRNSFDQWEVSQGHKNRRNASLDELTQLGNLASLEVRIPDIEMIPDGLFSIELRRYKILIGDEWNQWGSSFEHLKTLKLKHDGSIRSDKVKKLPNKVEELHLEELNGVKYVFNELDQNGFQELKRLHVKNIDLEIEHLFFNPKKEIYGEVLPKLEVLFLHSLKELQKIFHGQFEKTSLEKIRIITVTGCSNLKNLFSFSVAKQLLYLQEIRVTDCSNIVEIVDEEEEDANDITAEATDGVINKLAAQIQCLRLQHLTKFISFSQEKIIRSSSTSLFNKKLAAGHRIWNLTKLIIEGCDQLENLFFEYIRVCVEKLEHLEIRECKKMREIFARDAGEGFFGFFPSLKLLAIDNCPELKRFVVDDQADKYIASTALFNVRVDFFTLETMSISNLKNLNIIWWEFDSFDFYSLNFLLIKDLPNLIRLCQKIEYGKFYGLEQLTIENCPQLNGSLFDEKIEFPELKIMTIARLKNLEIIWKNLTEDSICNLRSLRVTYCQNLSTIFQCNSDKLKNLLESLKELEIIGCSSVKQAFELGQSDIKGRVKKYKLIFQQLKVITIADCPNMVSFAANFSRDQDQETSKPFFSTKFVFPHLERMSISHLKNLKIIWKNLAENSFCNLRSLGVTYCQNLSTIFPCSSGMLKRLLGSLEELEIIGCSSVKQVFELGQSNITGRAEDAEEHKLIFQQLKVITIADCPNMVTFASTFSRDQEQETSEPFFSTKFVFPNLERMSISHLKNLKIIWKNLAENSFCSLRSLGVTYCQNLSTIFPCSSGMLKRLLGSLEELEIIGCSSVKQVFELGQSNITGRPEEVEEHKLIFQQLKVITIVDCPNMVAFASTFSRDQEQETSEPFFSTKVEFPKLELLFMKDCPGFKYLMTLSSVQSFLQLKELVIRGCKKMEEVIVTEEFAEENMITLFPKLNSMELEDLPELTRFSEPQNLPGTTLFVFPKVTNLKFCKLPKLASFLPKYATEWPELTSIHVLECDQVQIFALEFPSGDNQIESSTQQHPLFWVNKGLEGQEGSSRSSTIGMPTVSFVKLRTLEVSRCHGLVTILRYTIAKRLDQLSTMSITDCSKLEEIVACEGNEVKDEIVFTQLTSLRLGLLPRLGSFCPGKCNFSFPSLHEVILSECPEMSTFSKGVVKTEKLQKVKRTEEDDVGIWKDRDLNSSIQHLFINKTFPHFDEFHTIYPKDCATGRNVGGANATREDIEKEDGQEREDNEADGLDINEPKGENSVSLDDSDPSVAQDAQESASRRQEVVLSSKEKKRGEAAHKDHATGRNVQGANAINEDMEKEGGQEKEDNEDDGLDVNESKGENSVSLDDSDPTVAQDAQASASKRGEVVLSPKENKRGEDAPTIAQEAQEQASKRGEYAPSVAQDAQEQANKRAEAASTAECIASRLLGNDTVQEASKELSKSIEFDMMLLEKASKLESALSKIEGLTKDERDTALSKLPDHRLQMVVFFSLSPDCRLAWVRRFLMDH